MLYRSQDKERLAQQFYNTKWENLDTHGKRSCVGHFVQVGLVPIRTINISREIIDFFCFCCPGYAAIVVSGD